MRPRKIVLLVCDTTDRMQRYRFIIETRGFAVWTLDDLANATDRIPCVSLIVQTRREEEDVKFICEALATIQQLKDVPSVLLNDARVAEHDSAIVTAYYPQEIPVAEWFDRLRILTARKRGPKKPGSKMEYRIMKARKQA